MIEAVPVLIDCATCGAVTPVTSIQSFFCSMCGTPGGPAVQGGEIQITALELPE